MSFNKYRTPLSSFPIVEDGNARLPNFEQEPNLVVRSSADESEPNLRYEQQQYHFVSTIEEDQSSTEEYGDEAIRMFHDSRSAGDTRRSDRRPSRSFRDNSVRSYGDLCE